MGVLEVVLLVGGVLCIVASFLIGDKEEQSENVLPQARTSELTQQEKEAIRNQVEAIISEQISELSERTEAQLDKISNTKILELNDYAETIIGEINRNHNETVFLYDMLNEKAKEVKSTVKDVNVAKREVARVVAGTNDVISANVESSNETSDNEKRDDVARYVAAPTGNIGAQASALVHSMNAQSKETDVKTNVSGSKDLAKERLIELVKKSTERSREMQVESQEKVRNAKLEAEAELKSVKKTRKKAAQADLDVNKATAKTETKATAKTAAKAAPKTTAKSVTKTEEKIVQDTADKTASDKATVKKTAKKTTKKVSQEEKLQEEIAKIKNNEQASKNDIIIAMHKLGMNNKDIAKELNLGIGEVKLIIDLYSSTK